MIANCGVIKYVVLALQVLVLRGEQLIQLFSENRYKCFISIVRQTSLIPRPSIPPVLIAYCIKNGEKRPGECYHIIHVMTSDVITPHFNGAK